MLFAPGLFSTMMVCPSFSCSRSVTRRVTESVMPPGVYGTTQRIDLFGQPDCAHAGPHAIAVTRKAGSKIQRRSIDRPPLLFCRAHFTRECVMAVNRQWLLDNRPTGAVTRENFRWVEAPVATPGDGGVLVRN